MAPLRTTPPTLQRQRGAIFLVMLVILIMGLSITLIGALSKVTLQTARNEASADLLAQAKEVVIGYMLQGGSSIPPGWLQPPDVLDRPMSTELRPDGTPGSNYDGTWENGCFNINNGSNNPPYTPLTNTAAYMRCLGRLPWQSFGMSIGSPSENDPLGIMPWYAFSSNLMNASLPINSELLNVNTNWLTVRDMNGNVLSNRVAFLIIIPGPPLPGQSRPSAPSLQGPAQYLDSITVPPCTAPAICVPGTYSNFDLATHDPFINGFIMGDEHRWINDPSNPGKQIEDPNYHFNDKLIYVTIDDLMPLIERRVAREVKSCLDNYAAASNGKYPWAAPTSDTTITGTYGTLFGRVASTPSTCISSACSAAPALNTALNALQASLDDYHSLSNQSNKNALISAANNVINLKNSIPAISSTIDSAGDWARDYALYGMHTYATVTGMINTALNAVIPYSNQRDMNMSASWPASCTLFTSAYWQDWQSLVFYQVADGYKPGTSTLNCANCLTIDGSGNPNGGNGTYQAAVIVAGKQLGTQARPSYTDPPTDYLSSSNATLEKSSDPAFATVTNAHDDAGTLTSFITYKSSDPYYQSVNDLVLCLDGKNNCK